MDGSALGEVKGCMWMRVEGWRWHKVWKLWFSLWPTNKFGLSLELQALFIG